MEGPDTMTSRFLSSLDDFLSRPWFRRIWVYPEVILAKCDKIGRRIVTVVAGDLSMRWVDLNEFIRALELFSDTNRSFMVEPGNNLSWFRDSRYWPTTSPHSRQGLSFSEYFERTINFLASDPRDKFFALLHLARDTLETMQADLRLQPNYEKSVIDIIHDFRMAGIRLPFVINTAKSEATREEHGGNTFDLGFWYSNISSRTMWTLDTLTLIPHVRYPF